MAAAGEPVGVTIWSPRYAMLDGWRIASAIGIIFAHLIGKPLFDFGQVCVLVFFVLSGSCITASAVSCRRSGLGRTCGPPGCRTSP